MKIIETDRLILRTWKEEDAEAYYQINQDPKVIEFLRGPLSLVEVNEFMEIMNNRFTHNNYAFLATCLKETEELIGFIGLSNVYLTVHFTPAVEIGWRLGSQYWGRGYATEGAKAALTYGFNRCGLKEIVSFTVPANVRSIRVMEKIGMVRDCSGDFAHPKLAADHHLSKHVLYRIQV